jgi:hypothetical protein
MGGILRRWGKPGKAGKSVGPVEVNGEPRGPQSGENIMPAATYRYGANPISQRMAVALHMGTALTSPMVMGRFRPQDKSAPTNRAPAGGSFGSQDLGTLQILTGMYQGPQTVRLGAQSGPSQQPGFPSTNGDVSRVNLGGLGLPDVWRVNRL